MPNTPVIVRRWEVVGAFILLVVVAVGVAQWNDYRIDQAERRISLNSAKADDLEATNERQDVIRRELLQGLLRADTKACIRIEELKTQNRIEAQRSYDNLQRNLRLLGVALTDELRQLAADELQRDLTRNAPGEC